MNRKGRKLYLPHSVQRICSKSQLKKKKEKKEKKTRLCAVAVSQICYSAPWWSFKRGTGVHKKEGKKTLQRALAEVDYISTGYLSFHASQMNDPSLFIHMQNYLLVRNIDSEAQGVVA